MSDRIVAFMTTHARLLDRRRAELALGLGSVEASVAALAAYRNPDGGFGALEPDLRAPSSQPVAALHAFEVFEEIAPATSPLARELCDWLAGASLPGGGLPFALPGADHPGSAPFWAAADPTVPSLHITTAVAGIAHRVARHDPAVAGHPWLREATDYCLAAIADTDGVRHALELRFSLGFLDALADTDPRAEPELRRLGALLPASGVLPVAGGKPDEAMRPLDFSPMPDRPLRALLDPQAIADDLDRLEAEQDADGGWHVDWDAYSPAAALEWRGCATVRAVQILTANGRLARRR
ncbi:MAG: hypothetical protein JWN32_4491 [Solirubrobacterales bacterium]|nr:hypothetical protein [Solirubrobacterales bacterium]